MKPSIQDVTSAVEELKHAMIASVEADQEEESAKLKKIAAHKKLSLARDSIRSIQFSQ